MSLDLGPAIRTLEKGGLVVYPTDTLYGIGAKALDEAAVRRVFVAKDRPHDQALTLAVATTAAVQSVATVTPLARRLFRLLPGPLTVVLEKKPIVPDALTGGGSSVGVRVPAHPAALALAAAVGPLTATSANRHGADDPRTIEEARAQLGDRVDYYVASPTPLLGAASTLVDARGTAPRILRPGAVSDDQIRRCLAE